MSGTAEHTARGDVTQAASFARAARDYAAAAANEPRVAIGSRAHSARRVVTVILCAPLFLVFEVWQLVLSERYLGIKQIARGANPRTLGLGELTAFAWSMALIAYWIWMLLLLALPLGRVHGLCLLAVSMAGFSLRRGSPLKWVLVVLTFEGAIRVGLLFALCGMAWQKLR